MELNGRIGKYYYITKVDGTIERIDLSKPNYTSKGKDQKTLLANMRGENSTGRARVFSEVHKDEIKKSK